MSCPEREQRSGMALVVEDRRKEPCRKTEVAECGRQRDRKGPWKPRKPWK